ncbi:MAG: septum site-determining protein MinD [Phototrophicales bacterium]|nr:MAG: septum site-determining protein MinD [Phototrophicales bacterium]
MTGRVITITSGKGGGGKTTTTANLAMALARLDKRVVAIDADIGLRNLDLVMGLENRIVYDLVDVIEERCALRQAMIKHKDYPHLYLIPASQNRDKTAVSPQHMKSIAMQLKESHDFILIDSPAGIEWGFKNALAPADEVLIVTNPEISSVRDADRIIGIIENHDTPIKVRLIVNRLKSNLVKRGDMLSVEDVVDMLSIRLIGIVPDDETVLKSSNMGIAAGGVVGQAYENIARRLCGEDVPFEESNGGFLGRFRRLFGNNS